MKTEIHPEYVDAHVRCTCGNEFMTRSTKPEIHVEICSACHPFYTGRQKLVDTGGRVERFQRRVAKGRRARRTPARALSAGACAVSEAGGEARLTASRDAPVGGQAVLEGVMMRGVSTWAVAVRKPAAEQPRAVDRPRPLGEIDVHAFPLVSWTKRRRVIGCR